LPVDLTFSRLTLSQHPVLPVTTCLYTDANLREAVDWTEDVQYLELALLLLSEVASGPQSAWWPWLDTLPHRVDNGAVCTAADVHHLLGAQHSRRADVTTQIREYQAFLTHLCDSHPLVRSVVDRVAMQRCHGDRARARALFMWAVSMVDSRSFRGRLSVPRDTVHPVSTAIGASAALSLTDLGLDMRTQFLCPFFDLINHPDGTLQQNTMTYYMPPPPLSRTDVIAHYVASLLQAGVPSTVFGLPAGTSTVKDMAPTALQDVLRDRVLPVYRTLRAEVDIPAGDELLFAYPTNMDADADDADVDAACVFGFGFRPRRADEDVTDLLGPGYMEAAQRLIDAQQNHTAGQVDGQEPESETLDEGPPPPVPRASGVHIRVDERVAEQQEEEVMPTQFESFMPKPNSRAKAKKTSRPKTGAHRTL
jgi:hypothetical protein